MLRVIRGGGNSSPPSSPPQATDESLLHTYARGADLKDVRKLFGKHSQSTVKEMILATNSMGRNAIHVAAEAGSNEILKHLLKCFAADSLVSIANIRDGVGRTPLFLAVRAASKKCVTELLKSGADVSLTDDSGNTLLHAPFSASFLSKAHVNILKGLVVLKEIDINHLNKESCTPLQLACVKGAFDCVQVLLSAKADPTIAKGGDPPLFSAVILNNPALVRLLLEHGADVHQTKASGQTILENVNTTCDVYRVLKEHIANLPSGPVQPAKSFEEMVVATRVEELPPDIAKLVAKSELPSTMIDANWDLFCKIIRFVAHKRIYRTNTELQQKQSTRGGSETQRKSSALDDVAVMASALITTGDPEKIFKKMRAVGTGVGMVFQGIGPDKKKWAIKRLAYSTPQEKLAHLQEAEFLRRCQHKNICAYKATYEAIRSKEDLLEGGTLDESLKTVEPGAELFEEKHLAFIAKEIIAGVDYLHQHNIVHRDLNSQNIMFTTRGEVKIIDFGSAISIADTTVKHTELVGSPAWMAPEVIRREPHSWQVDIWSAGMCLIELTNRRTTNTSVLRQLFLVATGNRPQLEKPDHWSELMRDFLNAMLQIDPTRRPLAAVLLKHRWLSIAPCSAAEMSKLLSRVFAPRVQG